MASSAGFLPCPWPWITFLKTTKKVVVHRALLFFLKRKFIGGRKKFYDCPIKPDADANCSVNCFLFVRYFATIAFERSENKQNRNLLLQSERDKTKRRMWGNEGFVTCTWCWKSTLRREARKIPKFSNHLNIWDEFPSSLKLIFCCDNAILQFYLGE